MSLTLAQSDQAATGKVIVQSFGETLRQVAKDTGIAIIADGYLRAPRQFNVNTRITQYPIASLLNAVLRPWGCTWRFMDRDQKTLLVRAENWWLEDASDVPDEIVARFSAPLGDKSNESELKDLCDFADLTPAQQHKLIEAGICPNAEGVVYSGWHDAASGARPWLRFYRRLDAQLQRRVLDPKGLALADAPIELVEEFLGIPLVAVVGAIRPSERSTLNLYIEKESKNRFLVNVRWPSGVVWRARIAPSKRLGS